MNGSPSATARQREVNARLSTQISRASIALERRVAEAVQPFDLTVTQYAAMVWLRCNPGVSNARLARWCGVSPQATSSLVSALVARGLVTRKRSEAHSRLLAISLTDRGIRLCDVAERAAASIDRTYAAEFSPDERRVLAELLARAVSVLA